MSTKGVEPWKKPAPKTSKHTKLTSESKAMAKARARGAGRAYPNLVDNMYAAKEQRRREAKKKA